MIMLREICTLKTMGRHPRLYAWPNDQKINAAETHPFYTFPYMSFRRIYFLIIRPSIRLQGIIRNPCTLFIFMETRPICFQVTLRGQPVAVRSKVVAMAVAMGR